jgi:hypothetical protein
MNEEHVPDNEVSDVDLPTRLQDLKVQDVESNLIG